MTYKSKTISYLKTIGYITSDSDEVIIELLVDKVTSHILSRINKQVIPVNLESTVVSRTVGEFLDLKYTQGKLDDTFKTSIVQSVSMGDIKTSYSVTDSSSDKLLNYISSLKNTNDSLIRGYRRLKW